ncbi:MAG: hypothetical protein GY694_09890 [Gammaproteobacteria bacterium]|nr:hypothetical protein [Gammaproteobacteria bacterium]
MIKRLLLLFVVIVSGCASTGVERDNSSELLAKFAYANCLMWYFEQKKYNTDDIRAIAGGIVETSNISIDRFQEVALFIKDYNPNLETKHNIDKNLLKCFYLEKSVELKAIMAK